MPAAVLVPAIASVASGVGSAVMQSRAAGKAAKATSDASNYAADRQAEAQQRQEQFLREQAQRNYEQEESVRRANYDQWAAREKRLGSIAERLGYGRRDVPAYVPSVNPGFMGQSGPPQSSTNPVSMGPRPTAATMPTQPTVPSARDVILRRKFPEGSIGAYVLARRQKPAGVI